MPTVAPLLVLVCVFAQACQPEGDRRDPHLTGPSSPPPAAPVSVSAWVASLDVSASRAAASLDVSASRAAASLDVSASRADASLNGATPSEEPQRPGDTGVPAPPVVAAATAEPTEAETAAAAPDTLDTLETADAEVVAPDSQVIAGGPEVSSPEPERVTPDADVSAAETRVSPRARVGTTPEPELLRAVLQTPSRYELEEARRLNKIGLAKHRRGEFEGAIAEYEAALTVAPAHVFSRYNLACALALSEREDEALMHLAVLAHQAADDTPARDRLAAARIDKDFRGLRADSRFRELTLATPILVTWSADGLSAGAASTRATTNPDLDEARAVHKLLRDTRWDAQLARAPWRGESASPALKVRAGADALDIRAARAILEELEVAYPGRYKLETDAALPTGGPALVLLVAAGTPIVEQPPVAAPEPGQKTDTPPRTALTPEAATSLGERLQPLLGKRLTASGGGVVEHLELRPTGFFTWERRSVKERVQRNGRWELTAKGLALSYSARITEGDPPSLVVKDGLDSTHGLNVEDGVLLLDGRAFR